jgi:Mg-chelatase subunit ChlI
MRATRTSDDITYFAQTNKREVRRPFGIRQADRRSHMYVIGKTGTGKSTLLRTMVLQDAVPIHPRGPPAGCDPPGHPAWELDIQSPR